MQQTTGTIGRWQGAGLMATTLLGTGIFILPQLTINIAANGALWAWILLTFAIIPVTLVFGQLSSKFPHAGGPAHFVEKAFGSLLGRSVGLSFLLLIPFGSAAAILITFQFVYVLFPAQGLTSLAIQLGLILLLYWINIKGVQVSAKLQFVLTLIILGIVVAMLGAAGVNTPKYTLSNLLSHSDYEVVMSAAGLAFWGFLGVEAMSHLATDFKDPKRDMLPAMMIGTVLVGAIYLACTYLLLVIPNTSSLGFVDIFDQLLGGYGAQVIGVLGVASGMAAINVYVAGASKLLCSFSGDKVLPQYFKKINSQNVPIRSLQAISLSMALAIIITFAFDQQLEQLIAWTNGVFVLIYSATMLSAFKLLSKRYQPAILLSCIFFIAIGISIGANMLYAGIIITLLLPMLYWQKKWLLRSNPA
ncbi:MAG: L-methionine/branched-chain amino acid transporter [Oceanospirillaceae bacterium]|nr:L-methionine/branched-chain amino acid transporter [Oceanospirillaceae bacterium]